jgi:phage shock protein E
VAAGFIILVVLVIGFVIYITSQSPAKAGGADALLTPSAPVRHHDMTPQHYHQAFVAASLPHRLLDVRTPEEFAEGHLPDATNLPLQTLPQQMATLPKDQPIVLYCRSGNRSGVAAQMLTQAGYSEVYNLGSIMAWQAQGLPVVKG